MSGVKKRTGASIRAINKKITKIGGEQLRARVALRAALKLTTMSRTAYASGLTVYGDARPVGVSGPLSLVSTGATQSQVRFVANGGIVRAVLTTPWARYLIGKYGILPNGNAAIPRAWVDEIDKIANWETGNEWGSA